MIENALAFASTTIEVSITNADDTASITVADDGLGIEAADLPHVFERLYVTKLVPERSESPSGLGLAIVRELARAMDGHVEATTSASGGAAMIVRFPVVPLPVVDDRSVGQAQ